MKRQIINAEMKVWDIIQDFPETYGVFRQFGYPDIRKGRVCSYIPFHEITLGSPCPPYRTG